MSFEYSRRLHFYETDAMGIAHHAVYLHLLEEARVDFLRQNGVLGLETINYPVLEAEMKYLKPLYFDDEILVKLIPAIEGIRLIFNYELTTKRFSEPVAFGKTIHVAMNMKTRRPQRLPENIHTLIF